MYFDRLADQRFKSSFFHRHIFRFLIRNGTAIVREGNEGSAAEFLVFADVIEDRTKVVIKPGGVFLSDASDFVDNGIIHVAFSSIPRAYR